MYHLLLECPIPVFVPDVPAPLSMTPTFPRSFGSSFHVSPTILRDDIFRTSRKQTRKECGAETIEGYVPYQSV
ncbi:hypothetical protein A0J61_06172 [Choanephora cucurbitarum]|uniref:Uncharacterized protein n=1 Tax=Choanephora cucurbitarum TaxID=101091 RepID=A0A1C7NAP2_9FUNG|nr:hypothetical protein A0J61_06172 [Choanephora cucurbitarum]